MGGEDGGFAFDVQDRSTKSVRSAMLATTSSDHNLHEPVRGSGGELLQQLDHISYFAGQSPIFGLRLTQFCDGSALGFSISHAIVGKSSALSAAKRECKLVRPRHAFIVSGDLPSDQGIIHLIMLHFAAMHFQGEA